MIVLEAAKVLAGVASAASAITYTIEGMELLAGVESYKTLAQGQLASSAGTLYTVPASTQTFIKSIHLANTTSADVPGVKLFSGGTGAGNQITGSFTIPANGWAAFEENGWNVYDATGARLQNNNFAPISGTVKGAFVFPYQSGNWYAPPGIVMRDTANPAVVPIQNRVHLIPFVADRTFAMKAIAAVCTVGVAASNVQFAVYASDPVTGVPVGNPLGTTPSASTAAATTVTAALAAPVSIIAGLLYWLAFNESTASVSFTACGGSSAFASHYGQSNVLNIFGAGQISTALTFNSTFGTWPSATGQSLNLTLNTGTPFMAYQVN